MTKPWANDPIVEAPQGNGISAVPLPRNPYDVRRDQIEDSRYEEDTAFDRSDKVRDNERSDSQFVKSLRDEYNSRPIVQAYPEAIRQYRTGLYTPDNSAGDQALITAFAKIGDPNSAVQQGEAERVESIQSRREQVLQRLKREFGWEGVGTLKPEARAWLRESMHNSMKGFNQLYNFEREQFRNVAAQEGIDPDRVVLGHAGTPFKEDIDKFWESQNSKADPLDLGGGFAAPDADRKSIPIPQAMQQEHFDWVRDNWGGITDDAYAQFRQRLDDKYGFSPGNYTGVAERLNRAATEGQMPTAQGVAIPPVDAEMTGLDKFNSAVFGGDAGSFIFGAGDLTGGMDEVAAGARSLIHGTPYETELALANATKQAARDNNPGLYMGGQLTSGLLTGFGAGALAPKATAALGTPRNMYLTGGAFGTSAGALEDNDNRLRGAGTGLAAGLGGTLMGDKVVAPGLEWAMRTKPGRTASESVRGWANRFGMNVAPQNAPELTPLDATLVRAGGDLAGAQRNVADARDMGLPYSIADASPQLRMLGGSTTRQSTTARDLVEGRIDERNLGRGERAIDGIRADLARDVDLPTQKESLTRASGVEAGPYYNTAFRAPAPDDPRITGMLETPAGSRALGNAREIASNEGIDLDGVGIGLDAAGNPILIPGRASYETLDLVKRGVDRDIRSNANALGQVDFSDPYVRSLQGFRDRFVGALDELNPDYRAAREKAAPFLAAREALDTGGNATRASVSPAEMRVALESMPDIAKENFGYGYTTRMVNDINNMKGGDPYRTVYGSANQREKISTLFPEGAPQFARRAELERDMGKLAHETLGGSPTQARQMADEQLNGGAGSAAVGAAGEFIMDGGSGMSLVPRALQAVKDRFNTGQRNAEAIAPDLFDMDAQRAYDLLGDATRKKLQVDERLLNFRRRTGLFGAIAGPQAALTYSGS